MKLSISRVRFFFGLTLPFAIAACSSGIGTPSESGLPGSITQGAPAQRPAASTTQLPQPASTQSSAPPGTAASATSPASPQSVSLQPNIAQPCRSSCDPVGGGGGWDFGPPGSSGHPPSCDSESVCCRLLGPQNDPGCSSNILGNLPRKLGTHCLDSSYAIGEQILGINSWDFTVVDISEITIGSLPATGGAYGFVYSTKAGYMYIQESPSYGGNFWVNLAQAIPLCSDRLYRLPEMEARISLRI